MKTARILSAVFATGLAATIAVSSCSSKSSSSSSTPVTSASSEGKDVTQPFTIEIQGALLDFPAGTLDAETKVEVSAAEQPTEFAVDGVTTASDAVKVVATNAEGGSLNKAKAPFSLQLDIAAPAALADVEKTNANLCVLGKDSDDVVRRWPNSVLTINEDTKKVKFPLIWFGTVQLLYCGDKFADLPEVNAEGSGVVTQDPPAQDENCNTLVNGATQIQTNDGGQLPNGTGGTILDGTYHATSFIAHASSPIQVNQPVKETIQIFENGTKMQIVYEDFGDPVVRATFTLAPDGTSPHVTRTCSTVEEDLGTYKSYTATDTTFILYNSTHNFAITYTRQL